MFYVSKNAFFTLCILQYPLSHIMRFQTYASKNAFYTFCILQYPLSHNIHFQMYASKNSCVFRRICLKMHSIPTLSGKMILQYPLSDIMHFLTYASKYAFYTFCILQYPLSHRVHFQTYASKNACVFRRIRLKMHSIPTLSGKMILQYPFSHIMHFLTYASKNDWYCLIELICPQGVIGLGLGVLINVDDNELINKQHGVHRQRQGALAVVADGLHSYSMS